jgi:hypothetical protein
MVAHSHASSLVHLAEVQHSLNGEHEVIGTCSSLIRSGRLDVQGD